MLLNPLGLLALAALVLPLLIHLFSRSKGRRVLVGNIALYRQARRQRVLEPRLVQWLLLLLRLALLALAALLLAGLARPGLESLPGTTAYLTPTWQAAAGPEQRARLEDFDRVLLLAPGTPDLAPGLEADASATGAGTRTGDPAGSVSTPGSETLPEMAADPWAQLAERLATVRHDDVHVFALGQAGEFPADAPALGPEITWHVGEPGTGYTTGSTDTPGWNGDAGVAAIPLSVTLVAGPDHARDADLLATALETASAHRNIALALERSTAWAFEPARPRDAVVWLAEAPPPGTLQARRLVQGIPGDSTQADFPDTLLRELLGEDAWSAGALRAPADPSAAARRDAPTGGGPNRPLAPWLALAMALLFGLERWLAERPSRGQEREAAA